MKKYLKISLIILAVLILVCGGLYLVFKDTINTQINIDNHKADILSDQEKTSLGLYHLGIYEVLSRDASGKPTSFRLISLKDETPITLDFMTDSEKAEKGLTNSEKIQVLERDPSGKIIAYKIIKNDSDIVKRY